MRPIASFATLSVALALAGCASQPTVHSDYDKTANSAQYRTYAFAEKSPQTYLTLTEKTLRTDIAQQLENRGYRQNNNADLLVYISTKTQQQTHVEGSPALIGWGGYGGWMGYDQTVWTTNEGTLTVDVVDSKKKQLAWRGTATGTLPSSGEALSADKLNQAVMQMFAQYPWTAGK